MCISSIKSVKSHSAQSSLLVYRLISDYELLFSVLGPQLRCSVEILADIFVNVLSLFGVGIVLWSQAQGLEATLDTCGLRLLIFRLLGGLTRSLRRFRLLLTLLVPLCNHVPFLLLESLALRFLLLNLRRFISVNLYIVKESQACALWFVADAGQCR